MTGVDRDSTLLLLGLTLALALQFGDANGDANVTGPPVHKKAELDLQGFADVVNHALPITGLVYGPVLCFFGFTWYAHIAQVFGFLAGGVLFSLGAFLIVQSYSSLAIAFMIVAFVVGGCIVGVIMRMRPAMCTFLLGGSVGVGLTYLIFFLAGLQLNNDDSPLLLLTGTALMIVFGAIFVRCERVSVIIFSSGVGAYSWLYGVGYFVGRFPTWRAIYRRAYVDDDTTGAVPWAWWLYTTAYILLLVWSLWEQCKRKESEHESATKRETETRAPDDDSDDAMATSPTMDDMQFAPYQRV